MADHPNVDLMRSGFEAFAAGDMATLDALFDDDAVWHVGGRNRFSGDYEGKAAIFQYFAESVQAQDSFSQDIHALFADDEHGVALVKAHGSRGGKHLESDAVLVFHLEDGKATEVWIAAVDPYALDEYWS